MSALYKQSLGLKWYLCQKDYPLFFFLDPTSSLNMELYSYTTSPGTYTFTTTHQHVPKGENSLPVVNILVNDLLGNQTPLPLPVFKVHEIVKKGKTEKKTEKLFKKLKITRKSQRANGISRAQKK